MKKLLSLLTVFCGAFSFAQTFNGSGGSIPDNNTYINFPIAVSGLSPANLNTTSFGLESVKMNITHPYDGDLRIKLQSPDGTLYVLTSSLGGDGDNYTNTTFSDTANVSINDGTVPFTGYFQPIEPLAGFNNGQNGNGTWTLNIKDQDAGDVGSLVSWSLTFGSYPAGMSDFVSSNLPIIIINTNNQGIPDEPKIQASMKIIDNGYNQTNFLTDAPNAYNNLIGIEQRGSSSGGFPQKSYGFETRDINGTQKDTIILNMPEEHDWILYAPYDDKTCMRNILTYELANEMGNYASRTILCELFINNQYKGIYTVMEKIKRDADRVNISKLQPTDISGDELTGGYIFKIDKTTGSNNDGWVSDFPSDSGNDLNFLYHYPKADEIVPQQETYIQGYVHDFEAALAGPNYADPTLGYRNFTVPSTFIDFFILNEISKNVDGYRLSTFIHKEKDSKGGKLRMGPMWDFNLAWWNADYCDGNISTGWAYKFSDVCGGPGNGNQIPTWWERMLEDPWFQDELKCRWTTLRQGLLSNDSIYAKIDSVAAYLEVAKDRHFDQWPIMGVYTWPNPSPIPQSYAEEIAAIKSWTESRMIWLDANIPGTCHLELLENEIASLTVYPNPFQSNLNVSWFSAGLSDAKITVFNAQGQQITEQSYVPHYGMNELTIDSFNSELSNGIYWIEVSEGSSVSRIKAIKNN